MTRFFGYNLNEDARDAVQDLLSINVDSEKGWAEAAKDVDDPSLKTFFHEMSNLRRQNADELRTLVGQTKGDPADHGSMSGQIHRWWINAKQALAGKDAGSVLNEAERGEDSIKHEYERHFDDVRGTPAEEVVRRQYDNVKMGHDRVKQLRNQYHRNP